MKGYRNGLSLAAFLFSGFVFAFTDCPSVGEYTISNHNADRSRCIYTSNQQVKLSLNPQQNQHMCPPFTLTDPHYQLGNCAFDARITRCRCTIARMN